MYAGIRRIPIKVKLLHNSLHSILMKDFEWRLFLPVLSAEELSALSASPTPDPSGTSGVPPSISPASPEAVAWVEAVRLPLRQYAEAMNELTAAFRSKVDEPDEARSDVYFVAFSHFGLKYRGLGKLELKVRDKRPKRVPGMEAWKKTNLGKKPVGAYADDLTSQIGAFCTAELLAAPEQVVVHKLRRKSALPVASGSLWSGAVGEMCSLRVESRVRPRVREAWLSISVEGPEDAIVQALASIPASRTLFRCLELCLGIMLASRQAALQRGFFPVLSGYPAWLQVMGSPSVAHFHEVIHDDCVEFLEFIRKQRV